MAEGRVVLLRAHGTDPPFNPLAFVTFAERRVDEEKRGGLERERERE